MIKSLRELDFADWVYGIGTAFLGGGAGAVTSTFTASYFAPKEINFVTDLHHALALMGATFLINGALSLFFYLKQSPLPPVKEVTTKTTTLTEVTETPKKEEK